MLVGRRLLQRFKLKRKLGTFAEFGALTISQGSIRAKLNTKGCDVMVKPPFFPFLFVVWTQLPSGEWEYEIGVSLESALTKLKERHKLHNSYVQKLYSETEFSEAEF
jgi:hypothetical protein